MKWPDLKIRRTRSRKSTAKSFSVDQRSKVKVSSSILPPNINSFTMKIRSSSSRLGVIPLAVVVAHFFLCESWGFVAPSSTSLRLRQGIVRTVATKSTFNNRQKQALFVPLGAGSRAIVDFPKLGLPSKEDGEQIASAGVFIVADIIVLRLFRAVGISFPSSLAACSALFVALITMNATTSEKIYNILRPGAALLAKWLPVFFVPSLITLPLTEPLDNFLEVFKVGIVIGGGFLFTLLTTAYSVVVVRKFKKATEETKSVDTSDQKDEQSERLKKPFSDELLSLLSLVSLASGSGMFATATGSFHKPLLSMFWLSTTLASFVFGARLPTKFTKLVHPLVVCTTSMWAIIGVLATLSGKSFRNLLMTYTTRGGSSGMKGIAAMGAGDVLLFMLGPAVVSLAISMYERRKLMKDNLFEVATAISVSTFGGLFGTAALVRYLGIVSPFLRLSLLSRNITRFVYKTKAINFRGVLRPETNNDHLHFFSNVVVINFLLQSPGHGYCGYSGCGRPSGRLYGSCDGFDWCQLWCFHSGRVWDSRRSRAWVGNWCRRTRFGNGRIFQRKGCFSVCCHCHGSYCHRCNNHGERSILS